MNPTFRPTLTVHSSPPQRASAVWPWPSYPDGDPVTDGSGGRYVPEDFALRECRDVDLGDESAIADFVREWGSLCPDDGREVGCALQTTNDALSWSAITDLGEPHSISAQRAHLTVLQALAGHYIADSLHQDTAAVWTALGFEVYDAEAPWWLFHDFLNAALGAGAFRPFISYNGVHGGVGEPSATTYEVAAAQLVQLIAQERHAKECANDRCSNAFTLQRGRRKYDETTGHTVGVRYCSAQCAKAQSERERRARRKAEATKKGKRS